MIKFLDLHKINARFEEDFKKSFSNFLDSGYYVLGSQVTKFEKAYAAYCGTKYCVGVSNGLDAIRLILEAYKQLGVLIDGDEVIVPANTYIASILAISQAGLVPVLVEPDEATFNIAPNQVEKKITAKTRAILAVHLYGQLANMQALAAIAENKDLLLLEDAAQAHGAIDTKTGFKAGNLSNAAAFSFYPAKNFGALGDAGAVTTNNLELYNTIIELRNYGSSVKYENNLQGFNFRLDEVQAGFLSVKLPFLDADNERRRTIAKTYLNNIVTDKVILPKYSGTTNHVFHLFVIRVENREEFQQYLQENGVQTLIHYPIPPHKQKAYKELNDLSFPITEIIHNQVLSLPISPVMTDEEVDKVVRVINQF